MTTAEFMDKISAFVNALHLKGEVIPPYVVAVGDAQFHEFSAAGNILRPFDRLRLLAAVSRNEMLNVAKDREPVALFAASRPVLPPAVPR